MEFKKILKYSAIFIPLIGILLYFIGASVTSSFYVYFGIPPGLFNNDLYTTVYSGFEFSTIYIFSGVFPLIFIICFPPLWLFLTKYILTESLYAGFLRKIRAILVRRKRRKKRYKRKPWSNMSYKEKNQYIQIHKAVVSQGKIKPPKRIFFTILSFLFVFIVFTSVLSFINFKVREFPYFTHHLLNQVECNPNSNLFQRYNFVQEFRYTEANKTTTFKGISLFSNRDFIAVYHKNKVTIYNAKNINKIVYNLGRPKEINFGIVDYIKMSKEAVNFVDAFKDPS